MAGLASYAALCALGDKLEAEYTDALHTLAQVLDAAEKVQADTQLAASLTQLRSLLAEQELLDVLRNPLGLPPARADER